MYGAYFYTQKYTYIKYYEITEYSINDKLKIFKRKRM